VVAHDAWVLADEIVGQGLDCSPDSAYVAFDDGLAPTIDIGVGRDPQELPAGAYVIKFEGTDRDPFPRARGQIRPVT
jgi:hypothetical protein